MTVKTTPKDDASVEDVSPAPAPAPAAKAATAPAPGTPGYYTAAAPAAPAAPFAAWLGTDGPRATWPL